MTAYADVALPLALAGPLTYEVAPQLKDRAVPGARVVVPVKGRQAIGMVTATGCPAPNAKARGIMRVLDDEPLLDGSMLELAEWVGDYYAASLGLVLRAMLPAALFSDVKSARPKTERVFRLQGAPLHLMEKDRRFARSPKQRQIYDLIESSGGVAAAAQLSAAGVSVAALRSLIATGLILAESVSRHRDPFAALESSAPPGSPTPQQVAAIARLESLEPAGVALLFGVTGSGKTLVYLEYLRRLVDAGKSAIVLVPEIGLTPQIVARFRGVFGDQVAVLHSQLSDGERYDAWRALQRGERRVAVGARSAVFAAMPNLGAIVVDEEHDNSYKQAEPAPRYHARQVAIRRAQLSKARVILGSATPSLETWDAAQRDVIRLVSLPERIGARPMPKVQVIDMREAHGPAGPVPWSEELDRAVDGALARGEQAMLLLNRRGFSVFVQCPSCGEVVQCPNCSLALTFHRAPPQLRCHHCDHTELPPEACKNCGEMVQKFRGAGTQQVEEYVAGRFPSARIARMDVDATRGKWAHHRILGEVGAGQVDILVGTQMIAKGLDFPNVTVVGVVDADVAINLPDFRAAERTFQLLTQVAGRAGRGPKGGRVLVQTRQPGHPAVVHAARHDVAAFAKDELEERKDPPYPPHAHIANLVVSGENERAVAEGSLKVSQWLEELFAAKPRSRVELLGPAPCPIEKVRGRYRWHLLLRTRDPNRLTRVVDYVAQHAPVKSTVRLVIDRDPGALL